MNTQINRRGLLALLCCAACSFSGLAAPKASTLINGKDFTAWRTPTGAWTNAAAVSLDPADPAHFVIQPGNGIAVNGPRGNTVDLVSQQEFKDVQVHVEFCIPKRSNSGVYLMGRYEVQIYDSFGVVKDEYPGLECGGIYPRWIADKNVGGSSPRVNVSKAPGEWQSFDITFRAPRFGPDGKKTGNARFVKVLHNGTLIHENLEVDGPTRATLWEDEKPAGPLRLQGDHGPVAYRNVRVRELK